MTPRRPLTALAALGFFCASCATPPPPDIQPGETPSEETVEGGLWMHMDRAEESLKTSGRVVQDPALNEYVRGIVCRLGPEYCGDLRVYIVRSPGFNASMAPNGMMSVWTGLILRSENEAQLATVLGHELSHYVKRHSLKRWQDLRAKTDGLMAFQLATGMVGLGLIGSVAGLATYGSVMEFSRANEREADRGGLHFMVRAGYDPKEASKIWARLIEERDASDEEKPSLFFSTHPQSEERQATLAKLAEEMGGGADYDVGRERFLALTSQWHAEWLRDELRNRQLERFHVVLDHLSEPGGNQGLVLFYRGEAHRLEGGEDARQKALEAYREALRFDDAPPEAHRALGLVYWSMKQGEEAHAAFANYLEAAPEAQDRQMIEYYLERTP